MVVQMNFLSKEKAGCYLPEEVSFNILLREAFLVHALFGEALNTDIQVLSLPIRSSKVYLNKPEVKEHFAEFHVEWTFNLEKGPLVGGHI